jgi:anti-sigma B factor antagonist
MPTPSAKMSVLVNKDCICLKISGRANFTFGPDFKTVLTELTQKGYDHFIIDLTECALMDSTFLGILAGFGLKLNQNSSPAVELLNPNPRVAELLESLGALHLFKVIKGALPIPGDAQAEMTASIQPTQEQVTRTCLEAHRTLMAMSPENVGRFKDVTQFLAEDLKNLEKRQ